MTWLFWAHVLLWGPFFVGAPVRPNMLNMPKSAYGTDRIQLSLSEKIILNNTLSTLQNIAALRCHLRTQASNTAVSATV